MDELRIDIWDYIFRSVGPKSLDEIAGYAGCDRATVMTAVNHEWFCLIGNDVAIAYGTNSSPTDSNSSFF